ncbi:hypothetical protein GCM10009740_13830 [Terrabacter terrae]|uniref:Transposase n=1 Tax=Terrabacter terrae TaxID=318434 RepID=A0ABN2TZS5_9MICO
MRWSTFGIRVCRDETEPTYAAPHTGTVTECGHLNKLMLAVAAMRARKNDDTVAT